MDSTRAGRSATGPSRALEDYLEQIHNLIESKGEARLVDIAANLGVSRASVSTMVRKLAAEGYVEFERYRGISLTEEGREVGKSVARRHEVLTRLLAGFGLDEETIHRDVEGMEHHVSAHTLKVLTLIVEELEANTELRNKLRKAMKKR